MKFFFCLVFDTKHKKIHFVCMMNTKQLFCSKKNPKLLRTLINENQKKSSQFTCSISFKCLNMISSTSFWFEGVGACSKKGNYFDAPWFKKHEKKLQRLRFCFVILVLTQHFLKLRFESSCSSLEAQADILKNEKVLWMKFSPFSRKKKKKKTFWKFRLTIFCFLFLNGRNTF